MSYIKWIYEMKDWLKLKFLGRRVASKSSVSSLLILLIKNRHKALVYAAYATAN